MGSHVLLCQSLLPYLMIYIATAVYLTKYAVKIPYIATYVHKKNNTYYKSP